MGQLNQAAALRPAIGYLARHAKASVWAVGRYRRAFTRRFGVIGWVTLLLAALGALMGAAVQWQAGEMDVLKSRLAERTARHEVTPARSGEGAEGARARLSAFKSHLLPHEDIPIAVQTLLRLAEEEGLSISNAEYRPQPDVAGGFLRYRMTFPVAGEATAIRRFVQRSLLAEKTLALESIRFKREYIESSEIEAQIQWAVFTRLPYARAEGSKTGVTR
ncbi:MAG TPA: hypothetical protein GXX56_03405 [Rhodocyclaceae bacterium]|nr:hypothetical protein [Rhodocyclaceae bacterium]